MLDLRTSPEFKFHPFATQGEASEDVYIAQVRAQEELEDLFEALDKATGQTSGFLQKVCFHDMGLNRREVAQQTTNPHGT